MWSDRQDYTNWNVVVRILERVRDSEVRKPGESIDDFMTRTYQQALDEYRSGQPSVLPLREEIRQRSAAKYEQIEAEAAAVDTEPTRRMPRRKK